MTHHTLIRPNFPDPFPAAWATAWGEDEYGLWMTLEYGGAQQTFRWVEPGTFLMGSPPAEPERSADELQHEVTLTRGYWLADTACTQGLWNAVIGGSPSRLGYLPQAPVEMVSWEDVQAFLLRLNDLVEGLDARLPAEAEWEYACRAGTTAPFSFGLTFAPEWAHSAEPHAARVPVKSRPPNGWGLYEMHGNLWEWCADWYGPYPAGPAVDPLGPARGVARVLRGGSWMDKAGYARSACRNGKDPSIRYDTIGFRLALGSVRPLCQ